jgi:hypothetical protein
MVPVTTKKGLPGFERFLKIQKFKRNVTDKTTPKYQQKFKD